MMEPFFTKRPGIKLVFFTYPPIGMLMETILLGGTSICPLTFKVLWTDVDCTLPNCKSAIFNWAVVKLTIPVSIESTTVVVFVSVGFFVSVHANSNVQDNKHIKALYFIMLFFN